MTRWSRRRRARGCRAADAAAEAASPDDDSGHARIRRRRRRRDRALLAVTTAAAAAANPSATASTPLPSMTPTRTASLTPAPPMARTAPRCRPRARRRLPVSPPSLVVNGNGAATVDARRACLAGERRAFDRRVTADAGAARAAADAERRRARVPPAASMPARPCRRRCPPRRRRCRPRPRSRIRRRERIRRPYRHPPRSRPPPPRLPRSRPTRRSVRDVSVAPSSGSKNLRRRLPAHAAVSDAAADRTRSAVHPRVAASARGRCHSRLGLRLRPTRDGAAAKSYKVTGLDLSLPLFIRAADAARRVGVNVNFIHGDMREMTFEDEFDAAYCMFTSFGYFDDDTNRKVAANLARAIKPGGKLLIELVNRDYLVATCRRVSGGRAMAVSCSKRSTSITFRRAYRCSDRSSSRTAGSSSRRSRSAPILCTRSARYCITRASVSPRFRAGHAARQVLRRPLSPAHRRRREKTHTLDSSSNQRYRLLKCPNSMCAQPAHVRIQRALRPISALRRRRCVLLLSRAVQPRMNRFVSLVLRTYTMPTEKRKVNRPPMKTAARLQREERPRFAAPPRRRRLRRRPTSSTRPRRAVRGANRR